MCEAVPKCFLTNCLSLPSRISLKRFLLSPSQCTGVALQTACLPSLAPVIRTGQKRHPTQHVEQMLPAVNTATWTRTHCVPRKAEMSYFGAADICNLVLSAPMSKLSSTTMETTAFHQRRPKKHSSRCSITSTHTAHAYT